MTERQKKAQEYLSELGKNEQLLKIKLKELDYLRELSTSIRSAKWVEDKVQTNSGNEPRFVSTLGKIDDLEKVIDAEMTGMLNLRMEIREVINRVPDPICVLVLQHRYIDCEKWSDIKEKTGMSERYLYNLHERALNDVADILEAQEAA